ncbi:MAG: sigma-70 family RNA polymerase sigma factor [Holophaga sp.]|nr:sigma-70 family RNA polymerase sigma factor [Holophaga sp.]
MDEATERSLVTRAQRGDASAFGELIGLTQAAVYHVCLRMMGERREAEDMAQETFVRVYERLHTFDPQRPFLPWVRRVAANYCLNQLARRAPVSTSFDDALDWPENRPGRWHDRQAEQARRVRAALLRLAPRQRAVVELRHFQELSYEEIAQALNLPISDVKSDLFRARRLLAEMLKDDPSN